MTATFDGGWGWDAMVFFELVGTVVTMGLEQLVQWRFGAMGVVCLFLIGAGARTRNGTCLSVGAVLFVLLMAQA